MKSKAFDGNVNDLLNTIVRHPVLSGIINQILTGDNTQPRSSVSPSAVQTDNRSTNVTSVTGNSIYCTEKNQRRFDSPSQELSAISRHGCNSMFQRDINHSPRRPVP